MIKYNNPVDAFKSAYSFPKNDDAVFKKIQLLLNNSNVLDYIKNNSYTNDFDYNSVADSLELMQYFTSVMRDESIKSGERLKAAELLAKIYSLFNLSDVKNNNSCSDMVKIVDDVND